jgi:hypothetical protein
MPQSVKQEALVATAHFFIDLFGFDAATTSVSFKPSPLQDLHNGTHTVCTACVWSGYTFYFLVSLSVPIPHYSHETRRLQTTTVTDPVAAAAQLATVVEGKTNDGSLCV